MRVLRGLLRNPFIQVPVIISCRPTPEVALTEADFERVAEEHGIDFHQTNSLRAPRWRELLLSHELDLAVAMLWLHTIDADVIETSRLGFVNCHAGLLPRYRGNACVNWAILNREPEIGFTVHLMEAGKLDSGPIVLQRRLEVRPDATVGQLMGEFDRVAPDMVLDAVDLLRQGAASLEEQDESQAAYCYPRQPRDGEIDWRRDAADIELLVRAAGAPYPGAYAYFADVRDSGRVKRLTIWSAHVEHHPLPEFHAVPGHVLKLERGEKWAVACGDRRLLVLDDIAVDGVEVAPRDFFRTVRQRLGLDVQSHISELERRVRELEQAEKSTGAKSAQAWERQFLLSGAARLEEWVNRLEFCTEAASERLMDGGVRAALNPARNYSFQRRFYDWEQRERWFGVQLYRSIRLLDTDDEAVAVGLWYFSDVDHDLQQRIYFSIREAQLPLYSRRACEVLRQIFPDAPVRCFPREAVYPRAAFVVFETEGPDEVTDRLVELGTALSVELGQIGPVASTPA